MLIRHIALRATGLSTIVLATVSVFSTHVTAQARSNDEEAMWAEVRKIIPIYESAVHSKDLSSFKTYLASDFSAVMAAGDELKSYDELTEYMKRMYELLGPNSSLTVKVLYDQGQKLGDVLLTSGTTMEQVSSDSFPPFSFTTKWTAILVQEGEVWKIRRLHASMDPVRNVFADYFARREGWKFGMGGVALGIVLGIFVALLVKRSRAER